MSTFKSIVLACCLILFLQASSAHILSSNHHNLQFTGIQFNFNGQLIDHLNPQDGRTFTQRYWVANDFFIHGPNTPVFLYLCGEGTCKGVPAAGSYAYEMAKKTGALLVALEHRYYGLSQPFGDQSMKTANLRYLTVEQALEDIAYFMQWFKQNYVFRIFDSQPWITIGGSYPGALSAWFRNKYPHLTAGAWASSAVVKAIDDFSDYDYQIYLDVSRSGPECPQAIEKLTTYFEQQLYESGPDAQQAFKARFGDNALKLNNEEFLYYLADSFATQGQYGTRVDLCNFLANYTDFDQLVNATIDHFLEINGDVRLYGAYFVSNDTFDAEMEDHIGRQWNYQVCSQLGWFQTYSNKTGHKIRSPRVNAESFRTFCKEAYGLDLWPDVKKFNNDFGGSDLRTTNLIVSNGSEDPWQWATKNSTTGSMTSVYVNCDSCAHCVDLHGETATSPQALIQAHAQIQSLLLSYLGKSKHEFLAF